VSAFVFLGAMWAARFSAACGLSPAWGFGFLLVPAVLISLDRMTVDVALAALCCGWVLPSGSPARRFLVLALAPLARETGLLLSAASLWSAVSRRKYRDAILCALSTFPAAAWFLYIVARTPPMPAFSWFSAVPFAGMLGRIFTPPPYPLNLQFRTAIVALDYLALAAIAAAVALAVALWWRNRRGAVESAILSFAFLAMLASRADVWIDAYGYTRVFSPLLVLLALQALPLRRPVLALPLLAAAIRVLAQLAPQALGIARCG
jgi:hypothetical protein